MRRERLLFLGCLALLSLILSITVTPELPTLARNEDPESAREIPGPALPVSSHQVESSFWVTETVDSGGDVGRYTSIKLDSEQLPHISYYDASNADLKYARFDGSQWVIETVDASGATGLYTSLALDAADRPHVSYLNSTASDLMYTYWDNTVWIFDTVDPDILGYTSLALDLAGRPRISYYRLNSDLYYAHWDSGVWQTGPAASGGDVGQYNSLALDSSGRPHISYYDADLQDLKYAYYDGTAWVTQTVDSTGNTGEYSSLALDSTGRPHISYYDASLQVLRYAYFNGTSWGNQTVDSSGNVGQHTSLALDQNGRPHISYYAVTGKELKYAYYNGTSWVTQVVDSYGNTGEYTSLALDSSGQPHISYYCSNRKDLLHAYLCTAVGGATVHGPLSPVVGETYIYSATYSPVTSTQPVRGTWNNGATGLTAAYSWTVPGPQTVVVTVTNPCGQAQGVLGVNVCQPVEEAQVSGPAALPVGEVGVYTAAYMPPNATDPVTLEWDNGTSGPSTSYSWATPGVYTVTVTATNPCGVAVGVFTVTVCRPVEEAQVSGPTFVFIDEARVYTGSYAPPSATLPVALNWNNGAVGPTAVYSWTRPGTYSVTVTAANSCSEASAALAVTVCSPVRGAHISGPGYLSPGATGLYTATYSPITATRPVTFTWDDGTAGPTAAYSWTTPGIYTITVTATNRCGQGRGTKAVLVATSCDALEWVLAEGPLSLYAGETGQYLATFGPPTATQPVSFAWDNGTVSSTATYSWPTPGVYTITVTATNPCGDISTDLTVTVLCRPLTDVQVDGPGSLFAGETGTYTATYSPLDATPPVSLAWDKGTAGPTAAYSWTSPGLYTIAVTGTNFCTTIAQTTAVSVTCVPLSGVDFSWTPPAPAVGQQVTFTGAASSLLPITFSWNLGDGTAAAGPVVLHTYTASGTYAVAMTATNGCAEGAVTHSLAATAPRPQAVYLPVVLKNWNPCFIDGMGFEETELNNAPGSADGPLCSGPRYSGKPDDDNDYFYLVSGAGTITVTLSDYAPGIRGQLLIYDETFTRMSRDWYLVDGGLVVTQTLGGTYYVRVYTESAYTSTVPYIMTTTFPSP